MYCIENAYTYRCGDSYKFSWTYTSEAKTVLDAAANKTIEFCKMIFARAVIIVVLISIVIVLKIDGTLSNPNVAVIAAVEYPATSLTVTFGSYAYGSSYPTHHYCECDIYYIVVLFVKLKAFLHRGLQTAS